MNQICDDILVGILSRVHVLNHEVCLSVVCRRWCVVLCDNRDKLINARIKQEVNEKCYSVHRHIGNMKFFKHVEGLGVYELPPNIVIYLKYELKIAPNVQRIHVTRHKGILEKYQDCSRDYLSDILRDVSGNAYDLCYENCHQFIEMFDKICETNPNEFKARVARKGLYGACAGNNRDLAIKIIEHYRITPQAICIAVQYACRGGHIELAEYLYANRNILSHQKNPKPRKRVLDKTFFIDSCIGGNMDLIIKTSKGGDMCWGLLCAARNGNLDAVQFCIDHGANDYVEAVSNCTSETWEEIYYNNNDNFDIISFLTNLCDTIPCGGRINYSYRNVCDYLDKMRTIINI